MQRGLAVLAPRVDSDGAKRGRARGHQLPGSWKPTLKKEISSAYNVLTEDGVALRGLFIIDKEGIVQHCTINNEAFGRSVDETLRTLQALQYVQENPDEVCRRAGSRDSTIKEDPDGSKEYFASI